jgi:lipoate---protein ligase
MSRNGNHPAVFRLLDLTLPSPVENLALDEALLDELEEQGGDPVLRFWESDRPFVVLGLGGQLTDDVHVAACEQDGVPLLRRMSGGGTVLQGPGCLSYAFVLPLSLHADLLNIRSTHRFLLERIAKALLPWHPAVALRGTSDLAIEGLKVSGNAQRRKRRALLFHGTLLYGLQSGLISRYLKHPKREPDYRAGRPHRSFLTTIDAAPQDLKHAIAQAWNAEALLAPWPQTRMECAIARITERRPG